MKIVTHSSVRSIVLAGTLVLSMFVIGHLQGTQSVNLSNVSVTLSSSRHSFRGGLAAGNTVGSSEIILNTSNGVWPSSSSAQLAIGDQLRIGEAGSLGTYTVTEVVDSSRVNISPVLLAGDADLNDDVIASSSSTLTARLTTTNAIDNGAFRILVPADTTDAAARDGIPDSTGFDYGTSTPTVTCPSDVAGFYDFVAGTATPSATTVNGVKYHSFECRYSGLGAIGTVFDGTTNGAFTITSLINPAPARTGHTVGYADTYNIIIDQVDSTYVYDSGDSTTVNIGIVESVRVTATVGPQITFRILGVNNGTAVCGITTDVTTTANLVPFGSLNISSFVNAAQALAVSTNAPNGYAVTTTASDQLGRNGAVCTGDNTGVNCIPDSLGDGGAMSHTAPAKWSLGTTKGFAYSLHEVNATGAIPAFNYQTTAGNCDGTGYCFKQFADAEDLQSPQSIFTSSTVADNDNVFVCYKTIISATQAAGDYSNYLTYTATATF